MAFSDIPLRDGSEAAKSDWFNTLRAQGVALESTIAAITSTRFDIANNETGPTDITGMLCDETSYRGYTFRYDLKRKTDTASSEVQARGRIQVAYSEEDTEWQIVGNKFWGDDTGVTITLTAAGQFQYASTNISGSNYEGEITFTAQGDLNID